MSWFSRLFVLPKDLNSGGDYVRKYAPQIETALKTALLKKAKEIDGLLDAQDVTDYVLTSIKVPSWARIMLQMLLYGLMENIIAEVSANIGKDKIDVMVDMIMTKLKALK